jgi:3-oxoacyl-(acyl-carrier-protein) synthase
MLTTEVYINGAACISPQKTIENIGIPAEVTELNDALYLKCIEPVYKKYIDPMVSRRMSRIVKMGIYTAKSCLENSGIEDPDAIITGTGLGCIEDTEKFLSSIILNEEKLLNPTPFIQSTHNTITSQISLALKCHAYNITYAHRGLSFESALFDSLLMMNEKSAETILLGSADEITPNTFAITKRLGHWKAGNVSNLELLNSSTKGSIAGEGSSFFLLSNKPASSTFAKISSVETYSNLQDAETVKKNAISFLQNNKIGIKDVDLVLLGINGDCRFDDLYYSLTKTIFSENACVYFKHLCGEFHTASSFAMWLAANIIKQQAVPDFIKINNVQVKKIKNILIYNHYRNLSHSFILLKHAEL